MITTTVGRIDGITETITRNLFTVSCLSVGMIETTAATIVLTQIATTVEIATIKMIATFGMVVVPMTKVSSTLATTVILDQDTELTAVI